ncbi:MAG TPA: Fe-S cluster protein [Desulfobacteraceae bacterium]|nr:Fe-S cluster protein [Desulfobacteraceae bacterium]
MPQPKNAMEIFQLLDRSNCQECGQKTCLAFAGAVFRGQSKLEECPKLDRETIERFSGEPKKEHTVEEIQEAYMKDLKAKMPDLDLDEAAQRTGGMVSNNKLTLKVLGKDFSVDSNGHLYTDIHINMWVAIPFLTYVIYSKGIPMSGSWVSFRELKDGKEGYPLFQRRCEEPMKRVADTYTDLFDDMVHILGGKQVEKQFESDISVVLYPLPKVPIMVCYWFPEDGLESSLHVFFDNTADKNLGTDTVFTLGVGLSQMFAKLALRHGVSEHP